MLPTPAANSAIGRVRRALKLIDSSLSERDRFDLEASDRVFRLAMGDMPEALFLPQILQRVQAHSPKTAVRSFTIPRQQIPLELANNSIDLAIHPPLIVSSTGLVLSIPAELADRFQLQYRELPFDVDAFRLQLYWHKNASSDSANTWLRGLFDGHTKTP